MLSRTYSGDVTVLLRRLLRPGIVICTARLISNTHVMMQAPAGVQCDDCRRPIVMSAVLSCRFAEASCRTKALVIPGYDATSCESISQELVSLSSGVAGHKTMNQV